MKVLIPENTLLWTTKGFCFGKDISYGTELFIINSNNELKPHPIIEDLEEPEEYLVNSLIFENQVSTILPNYKIKNHESFFHVKTIPEGEYYLFDDKIVSEFIKFQNEHAVEYADSSPISAIVAKYLALCSISGREDLVEFVKSDDESASKFNVQIQKDLQGLGGVASRRLSLSWGPKFSKKEGYKIFYDSKKLYNFRKQLDLENDKISSVIYSNGYNIFSMYLRGIFEAGFADNLNHSVRSGSSGDYLILNLPWDSKIRKLLQNTLIIENRFKLSSYKNAEHRNLNEVRLHFTGLDTITQKILEIKHHKTKCYEIDIPMGTKMIMDNLIVKPHQITDDEKQELEEFDKENKNEFESIRRQITSKVTNSLVPLFTTTSGISRSNMHYKIHIVGKFDKKGIVNEISTRFGNTVRVTGILYDDTGEIKVQLWGEISRTIKNNDILELDKAYSKNGILNNKQGGTEIIHKM